jgi:hypothetical protein
MSIVLRGWLGTGDTSNERFGVTFQHHKTTKTLRESKVVVGCSICRALTNELDVTEDTEIAIQAELTHLKDHDNLAFRRGSEESAIYRLDFTLEKEQLGPRMKMEKVETLLRTFALKPTSKSVPQLLSLAYMGCCYILSVCIERSSATDLISWESVLLKPPQEQTCQVGAGRGID